MQRHFGNIIRSERVFHDVNIDLTNMNGLSKDDVKNLATLLEKLGVGVRDLGISFSVVAEEDICTILRFVPNIETLSIDQNGKSNGKIPRISLLQDTSTTPTTLESLNSISFKSDLLQFNKIFDNIRLSSNFERLNVDIRDIFQCFELIKQNSSIKELTLKTPTFVSSIPIDHLKLKTVLIEMPVAKRLISCIERQTALDYFDLQNYVNFDGSSSDDNGSDDSDASIHSDTSESEHELDNDVLLAATKMSSLSDLSVCIDGVKDGDFVHFSKLSQLTQLNVTSRNLHKIRMFGDVVLPNVTRLLLYFKRVRVSNGDLVRIANNFSNVNDLVYEGEYFCDAFNCFTGNLPLLEKITIMRTHDYASDSVHYSPSDGANVKANPSLKSISLNFGFPDEWNVHKFVIRMSLAAPNVENLSIETDLMKFVPNNFGYILRNLKKLKNLNLSYDLHPDDDLIETIIATSGMVAVKAFGKRLESKIIEILKEHGSRLEYVQLSLSSSHDIQGDLWKLAFSQQFASIKVDDMYVTMKKDVNFEEWKLFA